MKREDIKVGQKLKRKYANDCVVEIVSIEELKIFTKTIEMIYFRLSDGRIFDFSIDHVENNYDLYFENQSELSEYCKIAQSSVSSAETYLKDINNRLPKNVRKVLEATGRKVEVVNG